MIRLKIEVDSYGKYNLYCKNYWFSMWYFLGIYGTLSEVTDRIKEYEKYGC